MSDVSLSHTPPPKSFILQWMRVEPAEQLILKITFVLLGLNVTQILWRGIAVDWAAYGMLTFVSVACFAGGQYYRLSGRSARIGLALVCTGLFSIFSWSIVKFNYLMMPLTNGSIDETLVWADSFFGYHWPSLIAWVAEYPVLNSILRLAYMSTIPQVSLLVVILGLSGRARQLHTMIMSITIVSIMGVIFWSFWPSHGTTAVFTLSSELEAKARLFVATDYGLDLLRMAEQGPSYISPDNVKGLIAFPSYHAVLAFIAAYSMRGVRVLFPIYLVLNAIVIPATLVHGGHHLVDIFGGFAFFVVATMVSERIVGRMYVGRKNVLPTDAQARMESAA